VKPAARSSRALAFDGCDAFGKIGALVIDGSRFKARRIGTATVKLCFAFRKATWMLSFGRT
jgi:hypothetical protein